MSNLELEKAASAPTRWIELCGAFEKRHLNIPGTKLLPLATKIINDMLLTEINIYLTDFFIVPGGRYLVISTYECISVLDLGCASSAESADCKLIASIRSKKNKYYRTCIVQATTDGMGLVIFSAIS